MGESPKVKTSPFLKIVKSKWTLLAVGIFFIWGIGYGMGNTSAKTPLSDRKVTYDGLLAEIEGKNNELSSVENEIKEKQRESKSLDGEKKTLEDEKKTVFDEIGERQKEFDEAMGILKKKDEVLKEIKSSEDQAFLRSEELEKLKSDIATKEKELEAVNQLIVEKEDEPISLSAGTYYVGDDFPSGRYKAVPIGNGSNFFVKDSNGRSQVNTILGPEREMEYIFSVEDGATIDTRSTVKLIAVE